MKSGVSVFRATVLLIAGTMLGASGCVLVVGGDRDKHRAEVEWASDRNQSGGTHRGTPTGVAATDGRLAREVQSRIHIDSSLQGEDITVSSSGDVVTLHGRVSDIVRLEHAMRVAAEVPGVSRVVSRLSVELEIG